MQVSAKAAVVSRYQTKLMEFLINRYKDYRLLDGRLQIV